jgi:hypothetical protein
MASTGSSAAAGRGAVLDEEGTRSVCIATVSSAASLAAAISTISESIDPFYHDRASQTDKNLCRLKHGNAPIAGIDMQ